MQHLDGVNSLDSLELASFYHHHQGCFPALQDSVSRGFRPREKDSMVCVTLRKPRVSLEKTLGPILENPELPCRAAAR